MRAGGLFRLATALIAVAGLSACATARMHSQAELNDAGRACGLTYGELIQDEEEKKLLILFRQSPSPEQRRCVYKLGRGATRSSWSSSTGSSFRRGSDHGRQ